ncbi:pyridoxamine 5'-phosphate oxidase [Nitzschia inconspicua]|uniref:Pyridoxamine 5'-phosphate oxidase n=1 Tax=Nitzschia inconspicua TaxID=303405 RepID=A0A9K3PN52_9STRA|nr:pyridoxamine 5'-phosphate oxidase [Nitzschia inconspicua]
MFASTVSAWVVPGISKHVHAKLQQQQQQNRQMLSLSMTSDKAPRHDVGGGNPLAQLPADQRERVEKFMEHQNSMPKIGFPVDVRSLVQYNHGFAVMSTNSKSMPGYPGGSVVGFAPDEDGRPIFVFSGMSSHTVDILADPRCSVTIADKNFKGAADGRVNLMGTCQRLKDEQDIAKAKEIYLQKHPGAFWIDFGDFFFYRMEIEAIRFVGGFARAGTVTPEEYREATPDPIMAFGAAIAQHMNEDHMSATIAIAESIVPGLAGGGYVKEAIISRVDSLGMDVKITRDPENDERLPGQPKQFKVRLPFPSPVKERKDVKLAIMEMTNTAAAASPEASN